MDCAWAGPLGHGRLTAPALLAGALALRFMV